MIFVNFITKLPPVFEYGRQTILIFKLRVFYLKLKHFCFTSIAGGLLADTREKSPLGEQTTPTGIHLYISRLLIILRLRVPQFVVFSVFIPDQLLMRAAHDNGTVVEYRNVLTEPAG